MLVLTAKEKNIMRQHRTHGFYVGFITGLRFLGHVPVVWANDDFQTWHSLELSKRFGSAWDILFLPEIRIRDNARELFYHEYRQGVRWKLSKPLQLGLNYLFVRNESSGKPREEH